jgi:hypothetical protein
MGNGFEHVLNERSPGGAGDFLEGIRKRQELRQDSPTPAQA